jgi:hypothetical protein
MTVRTDRIGVQYFKNGVTGEITDGIFSEICSNFSEKLRPGSKEV